MVQITDIDTRELDFMRRGLEHALIGVGRDGDAANVLSDEARLTAVELARFLSPKTKEVGDKNVRRDVKRFLVVPASNIEPSKDGDVRWIHAGKNFLTGVASSDDFREADNLGAMSIFQLERNNKRGQKYTEVGQHGSQKVRVLNRAIVSPLAQHNVVRILSAHVGRLKASILETAAKLGQKGIPSWISDHFPSRKRIFNDGLGVVGAPFVEFGSNAVGVGHFKSAATKGVRNRVIKLRKRIEMVLFGYAQDHNSGKRITKKAGKDKQAEMNAAMFDAL